MGTLYLVGTPIGNLEDISLRALRTLREVPLVAAEDTRRTGRLLAHYEIRTPLTSYHEHSTLKKLGALLTHLESGDLALVSDAGMPGLSDPGFELIRDAIARGYPIVPIPGPSAIVNALVVSGLPTAAFVYLGFLPRRRAARRQLLESVDRETRTLIAYESPRRLVETLEDIQSTLGERPLAVARELTKLHEQVLRGTPAELLRHFSSQDVKGEITLVVGGATVQEPYLWGEGEVAAAVAERLAAGERPPAAAKAIAKLSGHARREVYQLAVKHQGRGCSSRTPPEPG
jgi:16S rRNA (cytidine1402-2'-O)-methyltransferase